MHPTPKRILKTIHSLEYSTALHKGRNINTSINQFIYSPNQFIMKKKVFSLMMMLLLAVTGFVRADELTVNDGTQTTSYLPVYGSWADAEGTNSEFVIPAADLAAMNGGEISGMTFYISSSAYQAWTATWQVYLAEVSSTTLSGVNGPSVGTVVYEGALDGTGSTMTVTFSTPYTYNGGNLLIGSYVSEAGNYSSATFYGVAASGAGYYQYNGYSGQVSYPANYMPKTTFTYTAGEGGDEPSEPTFEDNLHVKYVNAEGAEVIDTLDLGVRPAGAWMEPFTFTMYSEGPTYNVTVLDFTPSDGMFSVEGEELPFEVAPNADVELTMGTNSTAAGIIERQFVAITEGNRAAHIWPVRVELYTPECPDVVEVAYELNEGEPLEAGFSYEGIPSEITPTELHNDYTLPFPEIPEGVDGVYKFTVENDVILNAWVDTTAENGKVALYKQEGEELPHPMADNNYQGLNGGEGGSAAAPFEAMIGDETTTSSTTYFPFHTLWNYSLSENIFLAAELVEAGVTTAPMTSLSWYVLSTSCSTPQNNINIWMANVSDAALTTTSHTTAGMTLVYSGSSVLPVAGQWNEFVFNEGSFAWDGSSNILIVCQRQNGTYQGSVSWQTHNPGFAGMCYAYTDNTPGFDATTQTYSMSTSTTNRPNIIMRGGGRSRDAITYDFEDGLDGWTVIDVNADGGTWVHSDENPGLYDYTTLAHGGTGFAMCYSFVDYDGAYDTDSYLVSPQKYAVDNNSSITFWADNANDSYPENFSVCVATAANPTAADFTEVWSGAAKGNGPAGKNVRHMNNRYENWREHTVSLSAYAGQEVWIAFHDVNYDAYEVWIDDVTVNAASTTPDPTPTPEPTPGPTPTPGGGEALSISAGPVIENLGLQAGTYYLVASATQPDYTVYINVDEMPCPAVEAEGFAFSPEPADNADGLEPASVTLRWMVPEYATGWRLVFGSTYHPQVGHPQTIIYPEDGSWSTDMANSYTVRNLWNNTNYFWHVEFNNGACPEGVSSPIWGFTTHLNIPQNLRASDETIFEGETVTLTWNAVVDRTYRYYFIYKDDVKIGETTVNQIGQTTFTVPASELTYNMNGYRFNVTAVYDEGESAPSDPVTVKVSGYSNETGINGYAYEQDGETPIEGVTVTITGTDEFGDEHTYTATTDENGYYHVQVYVGNYTMAVANKEGYQTTVTNHELPFDVAHNGQVDNVNFIMDENFVAPAHVCAELVEVNGEELVKVWWDFDFYNALIEDFETGDLSKFDWVNSASYPWTVVTTSPYEGTYCLKSGGAGVASVVSDLSVTVDVPNDGKISFYIKPSCESSWDYGYFYIDGTQKGSFTGAGSWAEKKYDITAGEHTFKWSYQKDGSVNANDDCIYVDYITFNLMPEPVQPGWHTYCESEFDNAYKSNVGDPSWGYEYPVSLLSQYAGYNLTKVAVFSDDMYGAVGGNFTCNVYVGGSTPASGTLASTITVDVPTSVGDWVEYDLTTPVAVTGTDPIWVLWTVNTYAGMGYPAGCASHSSDYGDWWNNGQDGWEHMGDCTWTMKNYFAGRDGRLVALEPVASTHPMSSNLRAFVKGEEANSQAVCVNPNATPVVRPAKDGNRALDHYNIYRTSCYNDGPYNDTNTVFLATVWRPDTAYFDVSWPEVEPGVYKWGVSSVYAGNRVDYPAEPRESDIVWSNECDCGMGCIDKDMTIDSLVSVNVLLNSADSPEGTVVTFTNLNEGEQAAHPMDPITLDATGFYRFPSFRKGDYTVTVEHDGYETITDTPVSIWEPVDLRYVMIEILYGIDNLYVSRTGWAMWDAQGDAPTPEPTPDPQGGTSFTEGFEGGLNGWTVLTVNADGGYWVHSDNNPGGYDYTTHAHGGSGFAMCYSFIDYDGAYDTDSYLITPQKYAITNGSTLTFWADNANDSYPENFSVCVATADNPTAADFTQVWSGSAKGTGAKANMRHDANRYDNWRSHSVDLSAYAGQNVYIAFHDVNYDAYEVWIDDVALTSGAKAGDRHLEYFKVMCESIDHEPIFNANTTHNFCQVATDQLVEGEHYICKVAAVYSTGQGPWSEVEWQYESCENYAGTVDGVTVEGNTVSWTYPGGDGPTPPPTGDTEFTEGFEGGLNGWTVLTVNADGGYWLHSDNNPGGYDYTTHAHGGSGFAMCYSFIDYDGAYDTDSYLITPQKYAITNGSTLTFWADNANDSYPESFKVCVATADNPGASDFTQVWSGSAKESGAKANVRHDANRYDNWRQHTVDLSAYAGQNVYIAFHDVNYDMYEVWIDDVALTAGAKGNREDFTYGFEGGLDNWTVLTVNADGGYWLHSDNNPGGYDYTTHAHGGSGFAMCYSFIDYDGAYDTDSYLITPQKYAITNGSTLTFWADNANDSYPESFKVCVATADNPGASDFTQVWSGSAKESGAKANVRHDANRYDNWRQHTVDLSAYAGQNVYIAFHDVNYDMYEVWIDDVTISASGVGPEPQPGETNCLGAMIFVDGEWEAFVAAPTNTYTYEGEGENICVRMVYDGTAELPDNNFYYAMSCEECVELNPEPQGCAPVENLTGYYQNDPEYGEAIFVEWDEPEGVVSYELYIGGELAGTLEPGGLPVVIYGLEGYPAMTLPIGVVAVYDDCESEMVEVNVNYDEVPENNLEVALFPNPTKDNVTIQAAGMNHITVMSVLGQVVYDAEVSSDEVILNMSQFNAGVYVVRIVTANGVGTRRVTVVK